MRKRNVRRNLIVAPGLLLIFYALSCHIVRAADLPFRLVRYHLIVVPVFVNGDGPFDFLLDTGTDSTLVTPEMAARLRLRPTKRVSLITVAGLQVVPLASLDSLTLGAKSLEHIECLIEELHELRRLGVPVCGVLGQNFLSRFNYLLDYRDRRLVFEDERDHLYSRATYSGARHPVEQQQGLLTIRARVAATPDESVMLVLDSAATGVVLFDKHSREFAFAAEALSGDWLKASGSGGSRMARAVRLRLLRIGDERFFNLPAALMKNGVGVEDRTEDGLLPTSLFRSIYFNHRENYVILNPHSLP